MGAALFIISPLLGNPGGGEVKRVVVTEGQIEYLHNIWQKKWMRSPTAAELNGLIEDRITEEILYREAIAMGLDRDDAVIRRRLRQKFDFLAEDLTSEMRPTDEELQNFMDENSELYRVDPQLSFNQVYLSFDKRGDDIQNEAQNLLHTLKTKSPSVRIDTLGDPFLLDFQCDQCSYGDVADVYGTNFADSVLGVTAGKWAGPVESPYGLHLVFVSEITKFSLPTLDQVRENVERDWHAARRRDAKQQMYRVLREKYKIIIDLPEWAQPDSISASGN
jgi:hypothetical protein